MRRALAFLALVAVASVAVPMMTVALMLHVPYEGSVWASKRLNDLGHRLAGVVQG